MEKVKLHVMLLSPFAKRIVWALNLKKIKHEIIYEDLANKSPELLKYNPIHKRVPVLVHNEIPICESLVILEYLDETWNEVCPFLPKDPLARAKERFWAKYCDEQVMPAFFGSIMKEGKDQEEAKEATMMHLKRVEQLLNEKKFFSGESFGFLDIAFGWLVETCGPLEVVTGVKVLDEDSFPNLRAWKDNFMEIPAIRESWPDQEILITKYQEIKDTKGK